MEEDNPFVEAFNKILIEEANNSKPNNQYILNDQNKLNNQDINMLVDNNPIVNNPIDQNEDEDMKSINNSKEDNQNANENYNNDDKLELSPNSLLGKKTKPDNDLDSLQISSMNKNQNVIKNEPIKEYKSISVINNENKIEEYDYGYSIIFLNGGETGLMEDFFNEKQNESTTSDFFNFNLDEDKWIKILNHSIYIHYERHIKDLKEENEKRKKIQSMYMNNGNNNPNPQMMGAMNPMNPMMFMNMGNMGNISNGVNYQQMYLQNLKNIPNQFTLMNK